MVQTARRPAQMLSLDFKYLFDLYSFDLCQFATFFKVSSLSYKLINS